VLIAVARHRPDVDRARPYGAPRRRRASTPSAPGTCSPRRTRASPGTASPTTGCSHYFYPRYGGDSDGLWQVASWSATVSPPDSDVQLLLVAQAEQARSGSALLNTEYAVHTAGNAST
jgi:hypothetical protein